MQECDAALLGNTENKMLNYIKCSVAIELSGSILYDYNKILWPS